MSLDTQKEIATKAMYAALGAPVYYGRKLRDYADKVSEYGDKLQGEASHAYDEWAETGEELAKQFQDRKVVEEIRSAISSTMP